MTLPRILNQILNSSHPLNNGHFFGVPRVAVVHRFDCILIFLLQYHRCKCVENPGEGIAAMFANILREGSRLSRKIARGPPILVFIACLLAFF
jgi:hypothetical protein